MHDDITLGFYTNEADAYVSRGQEPDYDRLEGFMASLPRGGSVLELGCGAGQDSEVLLSKGFDVTSTDGTPEIAQAAEKRLGRTVSVLRFGDLDEKNKYDGVWANACLLHVPRRDLPSIIDRIHAALKAGGVFYASFKAGTQEGRDEFDRYYNYPSADWLRQAYQSERWQKIEITEEEGSGYDQKPTLWLHVTATKKG